MSEFIDVAKQRRSYINRSIRRQSMIKKNLFSLSSMTSMVMDFHQWKDNCCCPHIIPFLANIIMHIRVYHTTISFWIRAVSICLLVDFSFSLLFPTMCPKLGPLSINQLPHIMGISFFTTITYSVVRMLFRIHIQLKNTCLC